MQLQNITDNKDDTKNDANDTIVTEKRREFHFEDEEEDLFSTEVNCLQNLGGIYFFLSNLSIFEAI